MFQRPGERKPLTLPLDEVLPKVGEAGKMQRKLVQGRCWKAGQLQSLCEEAAGGWDGGGQGEAQRLCGCLPPLPSLPHVPSPSWVLGHARQEEKGRRKRWEGKSKGSREREGESGQVQDGVLSGQGSEEVNKDFNFFLTATFIKPLERHVDEMRRLDAAERGEAHYRVIQQDCQL